MRRTRAELVVALVLVAAGVAVLASPAARSAGFGWFAYAPLSEEQLDAQSVWNAPRLLGAGLVVLGVLLLALVAGLVLGRRFGSRRVTPAWVLGGLVLVGGLVASFVVAEPLPLHTDVLLLVPAQVASYAVAAFGVALLVFAGGLTRGSRRRERA